MNRATEEENSFTLVSPVGCIHYDVYIMMTRTQITLDSRMLRRARERAAEFGISLAEYIRRLVASDLEGPVPPMDPSFVFDLGDSGGSDIAQNKDRMVAEGLTARRTRRKR